MDEIDIIIETHEKPALKWERPEFQMLLFRKRKWTTEIDEDIRMMILARALNMGIESDLFQIYGYLLTEKTLVFILRNDEDVAKNFIHEFYRMLRLELEFYRQSEANRLCINDIEEVGLKELKPKDFYKCRKIIDEVLFRLLTNRSLESGYTNPVIEALKDKIKEETYCSLIDYLGGEGPVRVSVIPFINELEK